MTLPIAHGTWTLDPMHTQIGFSVRHLGISTIRGLFRTYEGKAVVGADGALSLDVTMQVKSIDTGNEARDGHVQLADFFDAEKHPTMSFRATSVDMQGAGGVVNGELTLKGVTRPVTLTATYNGSETSPIDKSLHAGFEATGTIRRTEFGVSYGVPLVSDEVRLQLDVQLVKQP